jgi:hypothetical protein
MGPGQRDKGQKQVGVWAKVVAARVAEAVEAAGREEIVSAPTVVKKPLIRWVYPALR